MKLLRSLMLTSFLIGSSTVVYAQHGHEEDLMMGYEGSMLKILEPDEIVDPPYEMEFVLEEIIPGTLYATDIGFDFFVPEGADEPLLRRVTLQQVFISPGLFGTVEGEPDPVFGDGTPGQLTFEYFGDPEEMHRHIIFSAPDNGRRIFQFRLTDGEALDGTLLDDSVIYTLIVPEPASLTALLAGIGAVVIRRTRRRSE